MTSLERDLLADPRIDYYSYFTAARPSVSRHVYSIPLPRSSADLEALRSGKAKHPEPILFPGQVVGKSEDADLASYKVKFSKGASAYQLDYGPHDECMSLAEQPISRFLCFADGPRVPWQKLYKLEDPGALLSALSSVTALAYLAPFTRRRADDPDRQRCSR